mgnify:CR=1 FL=1
MTTVKIRWLGAKKQRIVDLPIGLSALSEKTGEVCCNPVGEFPVEEAKKLLALSGIGPLFVLESEYQASLGKPAGEAQPAASVITAAEHDPVDAEIAAHKAQVKEKMRLVGKQLAARAAEKRAVQKKAAENPPSIMA